MTYCLGIALILAACTGVAIVLLRWFRLVICEVDEINREYREWH